MNKLVRLTPEQRDNLVAYLDGELDEAETQNIEQVMSRSSTVQHDVEMLTRTFEMLDLLPRPQVGEAFTNRTLASLQTVKAAPKGINWSALTKPVRRALVLLVWGAALVLSVQVGFQPGIACVEKVVTQLDICDVAIRVGSSYAFKRCRFIRLRTQSFFLSANEELT